jgi:hypothetical protein
VSLRKRDISLLIETVNNNNNNTNNNNNNNNKLVGAGVYAGNCITTIVCQ